jgi:hypothetical protein
MPMERNDRVITPNIAVADRVAHARPTPVSTESRWWERWGAHVGYAAMVWSLLYGVLGLYWLLGGQGFPFGRGNDPQAALSILADVQAETAAPIVAGLGLLGSAVALTMARGAGRGIVRVALLAFAWIAAVALALLIPDYRLLMAAAYIPLFVIGAPFGWPPGSFFDVVTWPVLNQILCVIGGLCWAAAAVAYQRQTSGASAGSGRSGGTAHWTTPVAAARWGRWATAVAMLIPLLYAATRWAWALGIPLGISEEFFREGQDVGLWWAGAGLATVAVAGALLTLGLVQRWGEVFPGWLPIVGGKRVPPALAIVPATLVAILVTTAGLMFVRLTLLGQIGELFTFVGDDDWAVLAPELLWPLWGVALALATLAYFYRRRGPCPRSGCH